MKSSAGFVRRWGPALAMMVVIFVASSIPGEAFPVYNGAWDFIVKKSGHLVEYGLLSVLLLRGLAWRRPASVGHAGGPPPLPWRHLAAALGLAVLYGISDELHQRFTPGRKGQSLDVLIDGLGASLGLGLLFAWRAIRQTRSQSPRSQSTPPRA